MKKFILLLNLALMTQVLFGQNHQKYDILIKKADSLYNAKQYKSSAFTYSEAFNCNGWKIISTDFYNAACSWALANYPDSSFLQLNKIATKSNYKNHSHITTDPDLNSLHNDQRWEQLLEIIKKNKEKSEANLNKPLVAILDSVFVEDQKYRVQVSEIGKNYGWDSKEMKTQWKIINEKDSINLIKVKSILDKNGWLGVDIIGEQGNSTLFLVIQHSNLKIQELYLPMMREAVKKGNAKASSLALLEDRVALGEGKKQIFGSQVARNPKNNQYFVLPLEDPDHVDQRRAEVGLGLLADYVQRWGIVWNVDEYKKQLPEIDKMMK